MRDNRNDSGSTAGRVLFVCGAVLGVCLGLAAGHITIWSRAKSAPSEESSGWAWAADDAYRVPSLGTPDLFDRTMLGTPPSPAAAPEPFFARAARRLNTPPPIDVSVPPSAIRVATESTSTSVTTPDTLPESVPAAPIDEQTRFQEQLTRSIIAQEMPHASAQELEVWFDVLRGLDAADVKGILRMREHVGSRQGGSVAVPGRLRNPFESFADGPQPDATPNAPNSWQATLDCLRELRDIRLHNLCNADTIGFQRLEPQLYDVGGDGVHWGVRLMRAERIIAKGDFHETGRALDVAINGPGFLQVRGEGETRLTRCGRFLIDPQRRLALATTSQPWRLDPLIVVPEDAATLTIDAAGRVTARSHGSHDQIDLGTIPIISVLDPAGLQYHGEGLFSSTVASGAPYRLAGGSTLKQFGVERPSQTAMRDELAAFKQEERMIERLERLSPPHADRSPGD
ncbi:MAG: hypothetical protein AB7U20_24420 [Planctomycetaceae bacterium]